MLFSTRTRTLAVLSLKRMGEMNPESIKPVLMEIIGNKNEESVVRMAALTILPGYNNESVKFFNKCKKTSIQ